MLLFCTVNTSSANFLDIEFSIHLVYKSLKCRDNLLSNLNLEKSPASKAKLMTSWFNSPSKGNAVLILSQGDIFFLKVNLV